MTKKCLIIDNEDQKESGSFEEFEAQAKSKRIKVECYQFLIGSSRRPDLLTKGQIDMTKVIPIFKNEFKGLTFDLILVDWDFDDEKINGVDLIRHFQHEGIRKSTPKILYSGILREEIASLFEKYKEGEITFDKVWKQIRALIEINIVDFIDRTDYEKDSISFLKKNPPNSDMILISELRDNPDIFFNNDITKLNGKNFEEVAEIIENEPDLGTKFKRLLIEESIAYLSKLSDYTSDEQN